MNSTLDAKIGGIRQRLEKAERTENIGLAKYAIGLLAGLIIGTAPEDQHYHILRVAEACAESDELSGVLADGYWMLTRANDFR